MGIQGLLPLLSSIQKYAHLRDFAGQRLGIDAYGWLHRGTFTCATELAQDKPCRAYVDFALSRVRMLQHFGVVPYLVFDGGRLPSKASTEKERSERRKEGRRKGLEYLRAGKSTLAYQELQKSIDVTPQMARNLIEELKTAGIEYVVAPYEADSQLAFLEREGQIAGILSEDSDMLVFGAKVLITKLDQYGECVVFERKDFGKCKEISLVNWSDDEFRMMAILSGCDYLPGIQGIGLKSAYRLIRQHKTIDKIVRSLQFDGKKKVPANYLQAFHDANHTFLHQWVYSPSAVEMIHLNALPRGVQAEDLPFIGKHFPADIAQGVAAGDLHPSSKIPLQSTLKTVSAWRRSSKIVQRTPDLKIGKPISEFFKPLRTPLAELDPNSFTPSPSQQRLLNAQGRRSWPARSTPSSTGSLRSAMVAPKASMSSSAKGPKQRLCAEQVDGHAGDVSPYFGQKAAKKSFRKLRDPFGLSSDDASCDALLGITQSVEREQAASQSQPEKRSPRKRKRFEVWQEDQEIQQKSMQTPYSQTLSHSSLARSQTSMLTTATTASSVSSFASATGSAGGADSHLTKEEQGKLLQLKVQPDDPFTGHPLFYRYDEHCEAGGDIHAGSGQQTDVFRSSPPAYAQDTHKHAGYDDVHPDPAKPATSLEAKSTVGKLGGSEDGIVPQSPGSEEENHDHCTNKPDFSTFAYG